MTPFHSSPEFTLYRGDSFEILKTLPANSRHSCVTDPPYGIRFMGKAWDGADIVTRTNERANYSSDPRPKAGENGGHRSIAAEAGKYNRTRDANFAFQQWTEAWAREVFRVLKPGGHLVSFASCRTYHRMAAGIEDAGFEIRDQIAWTFGSGFPKSMNISKAIDRQRHDRDEVLAVTAWLRAQRDAAGVSNSDIDAVFGFNGMAGHWTSAATQPAIPTLDQWPRLMEILKVDEVPPDIQRLAIDLNGMKGQPGANWFKREVLGRAKGISAGHVFANMGAAKTYAPEYDVTSAASAEAKEWEGWGTALKPGWEPIVLARKPMAGTIAENVAEFGCGPINVAGCRVGEEGGTYSEGAPNFKNQVYGKGMGGAPGIEGDFGRWPANLVHDGSPDILAAFPNEDGDSASRFFYCAKCSSEDREEGLDAIAKKPASELVDRKEGSAGMNNPRAGAGRTSEGRSNSHPTVKPTELMRWLARLVTPAGGHVVDPFTGSGSTGKACMLEGFEFTGIDLDEHEHGRPEYLPIAQARIQYALTHRDRWEQMHAAPAPPPDVPGQTLMAI